MSKTFGVIHEYQESVAKRYGFKTFGEIYANFVDVHGVVPLDSAELGMRNWDVIDIRANEALWEYSRGVHLEIIKAFTEEIFRYGWKPIDGKPNQYKKMSRSSPNFKYKTFDELFKLYEENSIHFY